MVCHKHDATILSQQNRIKTYSLTINCCNGILQRIRQMIDNTIERNSKTAEDLLILQKTSTLN